MKTEGTTILIVDSQGGGLGKQLISNIRKEITDLHIIAVGTNSLPTSAMLKAGANEAATGENSILVASRKADYIIGPVGMVIANAMLNQQKVHNPDMSKEEIKKFKGKALSIARDRMGGGKTSVEITDREWEAIQAGAISDSKLQAILNNTDLDRVKKLSTPKQTNVLSQAKINQIKAYKNAGYTQQEIADAVGVSTSTVSKVLNPPKAEKIN